MTFRFSGHETFPCRYAWLPKAFAEIAAAPEALSDDEKAMIALGVGKNMVRAIRFWLSATGFAVARRDRTFSPTWLGAAILGEDGADPFLEDVRTLWLIHWQIATHGDEPLFAWDYLLNRWPHPEFSRSAVLAAFAHEARKLGKELSAVTLEQHFDVFLHSYVPTRSRKGEVLEDNLDCPLVELELVQRNGERLTAKQGQREPVFAFRQQEKPEITPELFVYCLEAFWRRHHEAEQTLTLRHVALGAGSPGQVFKLPEADVRERLGRIAPDSRGRFKYQDSAAMPQITLGGPAEPAVLLSRIFEREGANA